MTDTWTKRWDDRFRQKEFAYGTEPNKFFKEQIQKLRAGKIQRNGFCDQICGQKAIMTIIRDGDQGKRLITEKLNPGTS